MVKMISSNVKSWNILINNIYFFSSSFYVGDFGISNFCLQKGKSMDSFLENPNPLIRNVSAQPLAWCGLVWPAHYKLPLKNVTLKKWLEFYFTLSDINNIIFNMTQLQIKGWRRVRRRDILDVLGKRGESFIKAFTNIY